MDKDKVIKKMDAASATEQVPIPVKTKEQQDAENDYEYTRKKLKEIIDEAEIVLEHAGDVAKETGEPRSIEVYATLAKNIADMAKGVMENSKMKAGVDKDRGLTGEIKKNQVAPQNLTQNNQTIFVGTTKELLDMINKEQGRQIDLDND